MAWDRQTFEGEIQNEVDDFEADSLTVIRQGITDVCRIIWDRHDWSFKEGTGYLTTDGAAQGFTVVDQITDYSKAIAVGFKGVNENAYRKLGFVPYDTFLQLYKNVAPTVTNPSVWSLYAGQVVFDTIPPSATACVQITYEKKFIEPTTGTSSIQIPEQYKHVIKSGVKAAFWDFDDDVRGDAEHRRFEGQAYERGVGGLIGDMIVTDNENPVGPHQMQVFGQNRIMFGGR